MKLQGKLGSAEDDATKEEATMEVEADLIAAIGHRAQLLPRMDELLFDELWSRKQRPQRLVGGCQMDKVT